jgi:hypothetical protein
MQPIDWGLDTPSPHTGTKRPFSEDGISLQDGSKRSCIPSLAYSSADHILDPSPYAPTASYIEDHGLPFGSTDQIEQVSIDGSSHPGLSYPNRSEGLSWANSSNVSPISLQFMLNDTPTSKAFESHGPLDYSSISNSVESPVKFHQITSPLDLSQNNGVSRATSNETMQQSPNYFSPIDIQLDLNSLTPTSYKEIEFDHDDKMLLDTQTENTALHENFTTELKNSRAGDMNSNRERSEQGQHKF